MHVCKWKDGGAEEGLHANDGMKTMHQIAVVHVVVCLKLLLAGACNLTKVNKFVDTKAVDQWKHAYMSLFVMVFCNSACDHSIVFHPHCVAIWLGRSSDHPLFPPLPCAPSFLVPCVAMGPLSHNLCSMPHFSRLRDGPPLFCTAVTDLHVLQAQEGQ